MPGRVRRLGLLATLVAGALSPLGACTCTSRVGPAGTSADLDGSAPETLAATPSPTGDSVVGRGASQAPDMPAAPVEVPEPLTVEAILDDGENPYRHNPVSWQFLSVALIDGQQVADTRVTMTTTRERADITDTGLLFTLFVEVHKDEAAAEAVGESEEPDYRTHAALLTPQGLHVSPPGDDVDLVANANALSASLAEEHPTWPLPGQIGCDHELADLELPFGRTSGIATHCRSIRSALGLANVTTVWVDNVGFVYREIDPLDDEADPAVYRDYLLPSDLTELAAPPIGDGSFERLTPQSP